MRSPSASRSTATRILATLFAWTFLFGQLAEAAQPVPTPLADIPIAAKVSAKPNIIYTLDDSGSMQYNYLPDFVVNAASAVAISAITRVGTTATATVVSTADLTTGDYLTIAGASQAQYNGFFQITVISPTQFTYTIVGAPVTPAGGAKTYNAGDAYCRSGDYSVACAISVQNTATFTTTLNAPPYLAAEFNRLAYNPQVTYLAPVKADGTPFTNLPYTDAKGNYATTAALWNSASVHRDPYGARFPLTTRDNLNTRVNVPLYCNTDWPITVAANLTLANDVADANGQYKAGTGAWCRINGTAYDASAASGAPAASADYNYPWQSSSGAVGAQYFYKINLTNKILYCDLSSPNRPRNSAVIVGCKTGATTTSPGPTTQQVCNKNANVCNTTPGLRNYSPAACKTDPTALYCAPGTGGSGSNTPGTGSPPECSACNCLNDMPVAGGKCSINTGVSCVAPYGAPAGANPACPDVPSVIVTGCVNGPSQIIYQALNPTCSGGGNAGFLWDPATNAPSAITPLVDSGGAGLLCRRNNQTYAVTGAPAAGGLRTYPRTLAGDATAANQAAGQTGAFTTPTTSGCPTIGATVAIPRHYYQIASVQFCDRKIGTADVQWRGFGTGTCQSNNDLSKSRYVKYGQFTRVDLFAANPVAFPNNDQGVPRVWLAGASPDATNSESINYANWYAYYATRLNAAKTTSAIAFSFLTNVAPDPVAYRVGFHNLGSEPPPYGVDTTGASIIWVDVDDWTLAQRTLWYNALFAVNVNVGKTPMLSAMMRIGNLVEKGGSAGLPADVTPLPATAKDPFPKDANNNSVSCTSNYHILFTDGRTNQSAYPTIAPPPADLDQTIPSYLTTVVNVAPDQVLPTLKAGGNWPRPFIQGTAVPSSLADIATRYWANDLRAGLYGLPALTDDVPNASGKGTGDVDYTKDVAWWQHVNFSAISFGAAGVLDASNQQATMTAITAGTLNWPNPTPPNNPIYPLGNAAGAVAIDDLWHATAMGRGSFVYAKTPIEVAYGLASILAGIQNQSKSRTGAAFSGQVLDANNNILFLPKIEPGWAGDLQKIEIDPTTGAQMTTWWSATAELAKQIQPAFFGDEPWMDETKRRVVTLTGAVGPGVPFRQANLTAAQNASLATTALQQQRMVAYLRGGSTFTIGGVPKTIEGTSIGQFRKRPSAGLDASNNPLPAGLGDITNAQPVIVMPGRLPDSFGTPGAGVLVRNYQDSTDPGYTAFADSIKNRPARIVAPANDGMVHVIDTGPMPAKGVPMVTGGGNEVFAFVPKALFRGVAGNIATEDASALQALTYQDGGVPIFKHHMYVDSSPRAADVDFSNGAGTDWRTIVVGGLGKGGNSYYALDLTNALAPDEAAAGAKVLWEWSNPEVKYSYGRPVIVKVRETGYPTGRWVVIVTGGYNNVSNLGKIFFLDARNGNLLRTVTTTGGNAANPAGLAQVRGFVKNQTNQTVEQIYGGDLLGNLWRVDVSAPDSYLSAPAVLFAQLTDIDTGAPQPVTTGPQIEIDLTNGIDRYVFIGTGRLLDNSDLTSSWVATDPQRQTMYAIRDGTLTAIQTAGLPIQPRVTMKSIDVPSNGVSAIAGGAPNGWFHDLPNVPGDSERIVTDVQADINIAAYIGTKVQDDPCLINLPANLYARAYTKGESLIEDGFGGRIAFFPLLKGGVGLQIVALVQTDGTLKLVGFLTPEKSGSMDLGPIANPVNTPGSRLSWKLLGPEQP